MSAVPWLLAATLALASEPEVTPSAKVRALLAHRESAVVAVVAVHTVKRRWVVLEGHGDHIPLVVSECGVLEPLAGSAWTTGMRIEVMQPDYTEMIFEAIAPPAMQGRRYLLWAAPSPVGSELPAEAPWTAQHQGFLLVRGPVDREFVYWNSERYPLAEIRAALKAGPVPLDEIVDPVVRLTVAEDRMAKGDIGDPARFLSGILRVVRDPEAEAARVTQVRSAEPEADLFGLEARGIEPHALWFQSVDILRNFGETPERRSQVVGALKPLVGVGPEHRRLVLALTMSQLGSDAGRDVLVRALDRKSNEDVSAQPGGRVTFPDRFAFGSSAPAAAAHALGCLGDRRGLKHPDPHVRIAAADALVTKPDDELRHVLAELAASGEDEVARLRESGELRAPRQPGDFRQRCPDVWVHAHGLLARTGDDASFRTLVEALAEDLSTYPDAPQDLVPRGRVAMWSSGASLGAMVQAAEATSVDVLKRMDRLYASPDPSMAGGPQQVRDALTHATDDTDVGGDPGPSESEIAQRLASESAEERAEGLAAAGFHNMERFYGKVLDTARGGTGIERSAAIYALGFFRRSPPPESLREMLHRGSLDERLGVLELATRTGPERFGPETLAIVQEIAAPADTSEETAGHIPRATFEESHRRTVMTRLMSRMAGGFPNELAAGLRDPNPEVRRMIITALGMGGNPATAGLIQSVLDDSDPNVRAGAVRALGLVGPAE